MYLLYKSCDICGAVMDKASGDNVNKLNDELKFSPAVLHITINNEYLLQNMDDIHAIMCENCAKELIHKVKKEMSKGRFYHA